LNSKFFTVTIFLLNYTIDIAHLIFNNSSFAFPSLAGLFNHTSYDIGSNILSNLTNMSIPGIYNATILHHETDAYSSSYETHFITIVDDITPNITNLYNESLTYDSFFISFNTTVRHPRNRPVTFRNINHPPTTPGATRINP